ncbi:MAG TPA: GNAT family N-acetyltransferase [Candidatus Elarobacter sp.]|jgi:CelD/BcsL family acetyltransferase involved in cellulose biosynthesis
MPISRKYMDVAKITTIDQIDAERPRWEALERRDRHATLFTSWAWLRAYLPVTRLRWSILALRDGAEAVAYLPIARAGSVFDRELYLGGNPFADYTGMVADPDREDEAIAAFADALARERWDAFNASDVNDPRIESIVSALCERGFMLAETDSTRCLSVRLPKTWDEYVTTCISAKTRVNTLRVERRMAEALPGFRATEACAEDLDAHIDAALRAHMSRWGGNMRSARARFGTLFRNTFERGMARIFVYWDGEEPIAGAVAFLDAARSSFGLYMIGFDEAYAKLSPGKGIVGRAIRSAIESGYERFDFLRGDEPFKQNYADEVTMTRHFRLVAPGWRSAAIAVARPKALALKTSLANAIYRAGKSRLSAPR